MRNRPIIAVYLALLSIAAPALACLWDYDTLRAEARGLPGIAEIITGRFERNPPLYYKMRLERTTKLVEANAQDWDAYDSAAVACDRLGRHDEAIAWMARKHAAMQETGESAALAGHRYRYLANLGTFHAHRWFARGADRSDMSDMQRARELIAAAIELNPEAHFGRERYQLLAIDWILVPPPDHETVDGQMVLLPTFFEADDAYRERFPGPGQRPVKHLEGLGYGDAVEGLTGLIALGNAWRSVDAFYALAVALQDRGDASLSRLALLRCYELIAERRSSLHPDAPQGEALKEAAAVFGGYQPADEADVERYFTLARRAADTWHEARTGFMFARLEEGMHPDTHADFWNDYEEIDAPAMPNGVFGVSKMGVRELAPIIGIAAIGGIVATLAIRVVRRIRKARAAPA